MEIGLIIIGALLAGVIIFFKNFSGEKERIRTLFRIYKAAKNKFPEKSEREILEIVVGEHIPPGTSKQVRYIGITGKQYINEVYGSKPLNINKLIEDIIALEFPEKYQPSKIDFEEILEKNSGKKLSLRTELKLTIEKYNRKYLHESNIITRAQIK